MNDKSFFGLIMCLGYTLFSIPITFILELVFEFEKIVMVNLGLVVFVAGIIIFFAALKEYKEGF